VSEASRHRDFVIAATGLRAEARIAARSAEVRAVAGGGDVSRLKRLIEDEIADGGKAIISFGIAAGLAPGLTAGTCVIGSEVVCGSGKHYASDHAWIAGLRAALKQSELAPIAGVDRPLASAAEKHALHVETGALAADMESHVVAELAVRHGLPLAALRVIADPLSRELPPAALVAMGHEGEIDLSTVLASLARNPAQLPTLIRLTADTRRAFAALLRCHDLLGPRLGFRDLG
jgi:adenosylhomocysteine nucleosidase